MIEFKCCSCGSKLEIPESQARNQIKCPDCGKQQAVPGSDAPHQGFVCNHCGSELGIDVYSAGQMVSCPNCGKTVAVPSGGNSGEVGGWLGCLHLVSIFGILVTAGVAWLLRSP